MKKDEAFLEVAKTLETERSCEKMKRRIEVIRNITDITELSETVAIWR